MAGTDFSHLTDNELLNGIKALNIPDYIRKKSYGVDVRETLAQMTEMLMQLAYNQGMNPQEAQDFVYRINNKISKGEVAMSDLTQEVKEAMTGGSVAVVGVDAVGTENLKDMSVTATKLDVKYDFFPSKLNFIRRDISSSGYSESAKRFASDFVILDKTQIEIVNLSDDHQFSPIFFNSNDVAIFSTEWFDTSFNIKSIFEQYTNAYKFAIKVRRKDDEQMSVDLADFISSNIFVKTSKYPVNRNNVSEINKTNWLKAFHKSNFDTSLLTSNYEGHLMLGSDISTSDFHNHLLYFDTDTQRKIKTVKANFVSSLDGIPSNRLFIESSDGRVVWFSFNHLGKIEAFSLNKYTGTYTAISTQYGSNTLTYPTQSGADIDFKVVLVGFMAVVYIDDVVVCTFDLSSSIGEKINKAGISFRGNVNSNSILKSFYVQYQNDPFMHISVDDVFTVLKDLTENQTNYASLFDHPDFKFLKEMHDSYGAVFSLYVYNRMHDDTFTISNMTTKYKQEFSENANWLKFGYHSDWEDTRASNLEDDYLITNVESVYTDIIRFASYGSIDKLPRFGFFSANKSALLGLKDKGLILGALTADDNRASNVGLDGVALSVLRVADFLEEDGLSYFKTETRLDGVSQEGVISNLNTLSDSKYNQESHILFAHSINQTAFRSAIEWANKRGIKFDYPVNNI